MGIQFSSQTTSKTRHNWSRQDLGQHLDFYRIGSHNIYETHFHKSNSLRPAAFFLSCIFFGEFFSYETMMKFMNGTFLRGVWSTIFMGISRWNIYPIISWVAWEEKRCKFVCQFTYMQRHILHTHLSLVASVGIIIILIIDMILPILAKDFFVIIFIKRNINSFWK